MRKGHSTHAASLARFGLIAALGVIFVACRPLASLSPERLILIVVDTLRRDHLSCYGENAVDGEIGERSETPHIDALAARGQRFRNAMASYHQTSMSMASLFTGKTPSIEFAGLERPLFWNAKTWCGLRRFAQEGDGDECLPASVPTLAEKLRDAGYWTIGVTSNPLLYEPSGFARGFEDWVEVGEHPAKSGVRAPMKIPGVARSRHGALVNGDVAAALDRRKSDRFFLYVHYMDVHDYGFEPVAYARAVSIADRAVGQLIRMLEGHGLLDGAAVVLTSDHGERLTERHALKGTRGHLGNPSFQELLEVPLLVVPPIDHPSDPMIRTEDLFRILLERAGVAVNARSQLDAGELLLAENKYRTYIRGNWKSVMRRKDGAHRLFDLAADAEEMRDLAQQQSEIAAIHRDRIDALSERLSARNAVRERLSPVDRARLEALGYGPPLR